MMDYSSETRVRVAYRLTAEGVLDAARQGRAVGNEVTFWFERSVPFWEDLFTLHPILEWESDEWSPDSYVRNVFVPAGRIRAAQIVNSDLAWTSTENFNYTTWDRPSVEVLRDDEPGTFSRYFEPDELVQHELVAEETFTEEVSRAQSRCNALLPRWLEWSLDEGLQMIDTILDAIASPGETIFTRKMALEIKFTQQLLSKFKQELDTPLSYEAQINWASRLTEMIEKSALTLDQMKDEETKQSVKQIELLEARNWINAYGSSRLRKIVDANLLSESLGVYRTERMELERPGWFIWEPEALRNAINPSEAQIDALLSARRDDSGAKLAWSPTYGRIILATFLGRKIALNVDESDSVDGL